MLCGVKRSKCGATAFEVGCHTNMRRIGAKPYRIQRQMNLIDIDGCKVQKNGCWAIELGTENPRPPEMLVLQVHT